MADAEDTTCDTTPDVRTDVFEEMFRLQTKLSESLLGGFGTDLTPASLPAKLGELLPLGDFAERLQSVWRTYQGDEARHLPNAVGEVLLAHPDKLREIVDTWYNHLPLADSETQKALLQDSIDLWENLRTQFATSDKAGQEPPELPRKDRRFSDPRWREQPAFALIHQAYLLYSEQVMSLADKARGLDPARKEQLRFVTRMLLEALSPANFPMTNPVVLDRTVEMRGKNLVAGIEHLLTDLKKGQLTHTDPAAFELGRNIAMTPGKVVHETPLYQIIQYTPVTENVLAVPLLIFPPWINRFYILDLNPAKSFVRWAVEQGITVLITSWKSADASMAEVDWDDYVRAQIEVIDVVRTRLKVPSVHTIGYCVAGTTLAKSLAVLARRGEQDKVKSATFFTAQVDFEQAGELKNFIDDSQLALVTQLAKPGYLDGRYMAATFNLLRSSDLIWNTVISNYLLGEDYPAFDLLHWNGDSTNLPAKWHRAYLKHLYRDNQLVVPDALEADGVPLDLTRITVPCYIQAGREDHIAPPQSVWRMTRHVSGPWTFMLAGSGHIAGVVNPPAAKKYQYWTNPGPVETYEDFVAGAQEHPGSWWPHWLEWLRSLAPEQVPAKGKRVPGGRGDKVIEDAPGRYVKTR